MTPPRAALLAASAATAITLVDVTVVYLALPRMAEDLDASLAEAQWVVDAYALALAAVMLAAGAWADRRGRRRAFASGLAWFTGASVLCAAAPSAAALDVARALQGLGAAMLLASSLALITATHAGAERDRALGLWGAISGAALAAGPLLGGLALEAGGWRLVFAANVPLCALVALVLRDVPETRDARAPRPDVAGSVLLGAGLGIVVWGLLRGGDQGWGSAATLAQLLGGGALLVAFITVERRVAAPLLDPRWFRSRRFSATAAVAFLQSVALYPPLLFFSADLQGVHGFGALGAGVRMLPVTLVLLVVAALGGRIVASWGARPPLVAGLVIAAAGLLACTGAEPGDAWTQAAPGFALIGAGVGLVSPALASSMMQALPDHQAGVASGVGNTFRQVGIAVGVALVAVVLETAVDDPQAAAAVIAGVRTDPVAVRAFLDGTDAGLVVAASAALLGALAAALLPQRGRTRTIRYG